MQLALLELELLLLYLLGRYRLLKQEAAVLSE